MGNRKGGSICSGFRRQNQVQATTGQTVKSALESGVGGGEAEGLLLPAEPLEEVGRGDSIFQGCEGVKGQRSLVPVLLGD